VWDVGLEMGTLEQWVTAAKHGPFVLDGDALMSATSPRSP
jgi:hypothetical protein